eukprot:gnl/Dysnectes_brevis/74_a92_16500.p2 GENE.gnl/Dysnectes_brevis/74_a92_16500~~gnl/Dysnectes_brevis/74_a92_16500.p2  ORF type:complete len:137 (+),score=26.30 gnl/Dysnectes_brevis/74_a92_16500:44-412(+)
MPNFNVELQAMKDEELVIKLNELRKELLRLRVSKVVSAVPAQLSQIKIVRKNIARALTVLTQRKRAEAVQQYKGKKYVPKNLRPRYTRAIRRQLTAKQAAQKSIRVIKREKNFPVRMYALKL